MKKVFIKDECSPDAKTLDEFKKENNIEPDLAHPVFTYSFDSVESFYSCNGKLYQESRYWGVHEDLHQVSKEDIKRFFETILGHMP